MKQTHYLNLALALLCGLVATSCTDTKKTASLAPAIEQQEQDEFGPDSLTLAAIDWTTGNMPMFMMMSGDTLLHIYESSQDSADYAPHAARYTTLIDEGKSYKIKFAEDHKGKSIGNLISGKYAKEMAGLYYNLQGQASEYGHTGFAFTDDYLKDHEIIAFQTFDEQVKAPNSIIAKVQKRYPGQVKNSWKCAESIDRSIGIYRIQYEPGDSIAMGMVAVFDGDSLYTYEDKAYYYDGEYSWHADDDGEYGPMSVYAITRGEKGLDIYSVKWACESTTPHVFMVREGQLMVFDFASYYTYYDYRPDMDPVELPQTAVLKAELDGYKAWVNEEVAPTEDDPAGVYCVYCSWPDGQDAYLVATSRKHDEALRYIAQYGLPDYVEKDELASCSEAVLIKHQDEVYLIVSGCPDLRNTYCYVHSLPINDEDEMLSMIPVNDGFLGTDEKGELLKFGNYGYNDDGRFAICRYYDFDFTMVCEEPVEE